jgi:hypothetical protein
VRSTAAKIGYDGLSQQYWDLRVGVTLLSPDNRNNKIGLPVLHRNNTAFDV